MFESYIKQQDKTIIVYCNVCGILLHRDTIKTFSRDEKTDNKSAYLECPVCHTQESVNYNED
jgi:uncharacterized Zn finger protein